MALDPQAAAFIELAAAAPPLSEDPIEQLRLGSAAMARRLADPRPVDSIEAIDIPTSAGSVAARVYRPGEDVEDVVVYFHGGGWVLGDLDMVETLCTALAVETPAVVVSVDYRLAPEHPFPAAADDAEDAFAWIVAHLDALGLAGSRVSVAGDSAGANLAAVVAASDRDFASRPASQMLFYPVTDHDFENESYRQNGEGYYLSSAGMRKFWELYAPEESKRDDPRASPLRAQGFARLPRTLVITAEYDPLRDEGVAYARRLEEAGVEVESTIYPGQIHSFVTRLGFIDAAADAVRQAAAFLTRAAG